MYVYLMVLYRVDRHTNLFVCRQKKKGYHLVNQIRNEVGFCLTVDNQDSCQSSPLNRLANVFLPLITGGKRKNYFLSKYS